MKIYPPDPEIIDLWGLDGPGASETITQGGGLRPPPFGICFWGPRGRPDPQKTMISGSWGVGFHDYIDTKLGLGCISGSVVLSGPGFVRVQNLPDQSIITRGYPTKGT